METRQEIIARFDEVSVRTAFQTHHDMKTLLMVLLDIRELLLDKKTPCAAKDV